MSRVIAGSWFYEKIVQNLYKSNYKRPDKDPESPMTSWANIIEYLNQRDSYLAVIYSWAPGKGNIHSVIRWKWVIDVQIKPKMAN